MKFKKFLVALLIVPVLAIAACQHNVPSGQALENQQARQGQISLENNQPIPHYNYSQIRQNLIELETAQANGVQTTSFFFNLGVADPIDHCSSIGAPIATTTQLTNPQQLSWTYPNNSSGSRVDGVISQMDPNGVYTADSSGTYVMCVTADGSVAPRYWEGFVQSIFGPATWDQASHSVKLLGPPTGGFTAKSTK